MWDISVYAHHRLQPVDCQLQVTVNNYPLVVTVPPFRNPITATSVDGSDVVVTTKYPHGLFATKANAKVLVGDYTFVTPGIRLLPQFCEYKSDQCFSVKSGHPDIKTLISEKPEFVISEITTSTQRFCDALRMRLPSSVQVSVGATRNQINILSIKYEISSSQRGGLREFLGLRAVGPNLLSGTVKSTNLHAPCLRSGLEMLKRVAVSKKIPICRIIGSTWHKIIELPPGLYDLLTIGALFESVLSKQKIDVDVHEEGLILRSDTPFSVVACNHESQPLSLPPGFCCDNTTRAALKLLCLKNQDAVYVPLLGHNVTVTKDGSQTTVYPHMTVTNDASSFQTPAFAEYVWQEVAGHKVRLSRDVPKVKKVNHFLADPYRLEVLSLVKEGRPICFCETQEGFSVVRP